MSVTASAVGDRIRQARLAHGWTNEELARRMAVNWRTVHRWQKGQLPKFETLARLADVLEVPEAYLVESGDLAATLADLSSRLDDLARRVDELTRAIEGEAPGR
jgi:transcriptional regulator with XRE-family HTH domain